MSIDDTRRHSPAAQRNRQPILEVLRRVLPARGTALEIASGTGQHAAFFAAGLPQWTWQPTDVDPDALASIAAWRSADWLPNLLAPCRLDVADAPWPGVSTVDAIFCANMLHIAPWSACEALLRGAALHLAPKGVLVIYGPFFVDGEPAAPGNLAFDADLRARDPRWGVRRLADVVDAAHAAGLQLAESIAMPANNRTLVFRRT
jgi:SAM-dependent methyltransferase